MHDPPTSSYPKATREQPAKHLGWFLQHLNQVPFCASSTTVDCKSSFDVNWNKLLWMGIAAHSVNLVWAKWCESVCQTPPWKVTRVPGKKEERRVRKDNGHHWESNRWGRGGAGVGETRGFAFESQVRNGNKERKGRRWQVKEKQQWDA